MAEVPALGRYPREKQNPCGYREETRDHRGPGTDPLVEPGTDQRPHDDREVERREGEPGLRRRVAQHPLHVERAQEHRRRGGGGQRERDEVGTDEPARPQGTKRNERIFDPLLYQDKRTNEYKREKESPQGPHGEDAPLFGPGESVDQKSKPRRDRNRARRVEPRWSRFVPALLEYRGSQRQPQNPDRDVDEEHPLPSQTLGEDAAQHPPRSTPARRSRGPHAQCPLALLTLREGPRKHTEGGRRHDGRSQTLHDARGYQGEGRSRQTTGQRCPREQGEPGYEEPATTVKVGRAAREHQETPENERVGRDDPLQICPRKT